MNTKKRLSKIRQKEQNIRPGKNSNWILFGVGAGILLLIIASYTYFFFNEPNKNAYQIYDNIEVPSNVVCMKGDLIKPNSTIRVEILGNFYQVCCEKCENKLINNINYRQATDPFTGKTIDKSDSFIVLNPAKNEKVIYFESEDNYESYKKLIGK